jgi:hypothetical protein
MPEYKERKMIVVDSCGNCPYLGKCKAWKSLTKQQKFVLACGGEIKAFILNGCPLPSGEDSAESTNLNVK